MSIDTPSVPVTNDVIEKVMSMAATEPAPVVQEPEIILPTDNVFDLPGGYISPVGEVAREAEVRELTGRDEEQIAKANTVSKALNTILARGLVRVGDTAVDEMVLNNMLAGDRDYCLVRIYASTFGKDVKAVRFCGQCATDVEVSVDLLKDVPLRTLENPGERRFTIACSIGDVTVDLPTGYTQRELMAASDKTLAELSTILLENTVIAVNGKSVHGKAVVLDMPIRDRRTVNDEIARRNPGPQLQDVATECPNCATPMEVPLSVAALFQF